MSHSALQKEASYPMTVITDCRVLAHDLNAINDSIEQLKKEPNYRLTSEQKAEALGIIEEVEQKLAKVKRKI